MDDRILADLFEVAVDRVGLCRVLRAGQQAAHPAIEAEHGGQQAKLLQRLRHGAAIEIEPQLAGLGHLGHLATEEGLVAAQAEHHRQQAEREQRLEQAGDGTGQGHGVAVGVGAP